MPTTGSICRKVKPILDTYILNIIIYYSSGQELSVGEGMVKYQEMDRWKGVDAEEASEVGIQDLVLLLCLLWLSLHVSGIPG